jgi:hypothetical protein
VPITGSVGARAAICSGRPPFPPVIPLRPCSRYANSAFAIPSAGEGAEPDHADRQQRERSRLGNPCWWHL